MSNNPLRGKQNADVDEATAHRRTHPQQKRNNRKKKNKNVPMVLKMLYNWDDMHIFGFAFPKKKKHRLHSLIC